jgi:hypothetical protein
MNLGLNEIYLIKKNGDTFLEHIFEKETDAINYIKNNIKNNIKNCITNTMMWVEKWVWDEDYENFKYKAIRYTKTNY